MTYKIQFNNNVNENRLYCKIKCKKCKSINDCIIIYEKIDIIDHKKFRK